MPDGPYKKKEVFKVHKNSEVFKELRHGDQVLHRNERTKMVKVARIKPGQIPPRPSYVDSADSITNVHLGDEVPVEIEVIEMAEEEFIRKYYIEDERFNPTEGYAKWSHSSSISEMSSSNLQNELSVSGNIKSCQENQAPSNQPVSSNVSTSSKKNTTDARKCGSIGSRSQKKKQLFPSIIREVGLSVMNGIFGTKVRRWSFGLGLTASIMLMICLRLLQLAFIALLTTVHLM